MFIIDDIIILVAAVALSILLAPKPPKPRASTISDFQLPTAEEGRAIPVVFGTVDITGPNVLWYGALKTVAHTKHSMFSSQTIGYYYFLGWHLGLCHGPVDAVLRISWADKLCWLGNITATGTSGIHNESLFGGDQSEGGIRGAFDIVMGAPDEAQNAYLSSQLGVVPAYRGIVSFIWKTGLQTASYSQPDGSFKTETTDSGYIGTTPYMKPLAIRIQRIVAGWDAPGAWYPETAVVATQTVLAGAPNWTESFQTSNFGAITIGATTIGYPSGDLNINAQTAGYLFVDSEWMKINSVNTIAHTMSVTRHEFSTSAATHADGSLIRIWLIDSSTTNQMNAAHIVYQCLTSRKWGMGLSRAVLDDTAFRAAADTFYAESMGLSMQWVNASTVEDFLQIVLSHCSAALTFNISTGLWSLVPIRGGYDPSTFALFDESNIKSLDDLQVPGFADQPNQVTIAYTDPGTGKDTGITAQNLASVDIQGKVVGVTLSFQGIRAHRLAFDVLGRELTSRTTPLVRARFTVNRAAWKLKYGGLIRFSWSKRKIINMVMRVTNLDKGTLNANQIVVDCVQDTFSLGLMNFNASTPIRLGGVSTPPAPEVASSGPTVISSNTTAPPSSSANGDRYLLPSGVTLTGAWAGKGGTVAVWDGGLSAWVFIPVPEGTPIYDQGSTSYKTVIGGVVGAVPLGSTDALYAQIFGA